MHKRTDMSILFFLPRALTFTPKMSLRPLTQQKNTLSQILKPTGEQRGPRFHPQGGRLAPEQLPTSVGGKPVICHIYVAFEPTYMCIYVDICCRYVSQSCRCMRKKPTYMRVLPHIYVLFSTYINNISGLKLTYTCRIYRRKPTYMNPHICGTGDRCRPKIHVYATLNSTYMCENLHICPYQSHIYVRFVTYTL
jgi:hypothetical protein